MGSNLNTLQPFEKGRATHLGSRSKELKLFAVPEEDAEMYKHRAVVRNNPKTIKWRMRGRNSANWDVSQLNKEKVVVPLPIRSMSNYDWRDLFWLNVVELYIDGRQVKDGICGQCRYLTKCTLGGMMSKETFKCKTQKKKLRFLISRVSPRRVSSRRGSDTSQSQ